MYNQCYFLTEGKILDKVQAIFNKSKKKSTKATGSKLNNAPVATLDDLKGFLDECFDEEELNELLTIDKVKPEFKKEIDQSIKAINGNDNDVRLYKLITYSYKGRKLVVLEMKTKETKKVINYTLITTGSGNLRYMDIFEFEAN